jgi:hypothetical protein
MIFGRRRNRSSAPVGFYRFESARTNGTLTGFGDGDYVRLRDEYGNVWTGSAEKEGSDTVRYRFRDTKGKSITGISDTYGIVLRDEKGNTWRGFLE